MPSRLSRTIFAGRPGLACVASKAHGWPRVWLWAPVVIAFGVIACESTGTFSAQNTSSWLRPIVERITGHIPDNLWGWGHHIFRKSGHLTGYALMCFTFLRAWLWTRARQPALSLIGWRLQSCLVSILCTAAVASLDEWHQTTIPSRTGAIADVGIDTLGALLGCVVVAFVFQWWRLSQVRITSAVTAPDREPA